MRDMFSMSAAALISVVTSDSPPSNSARSADNYIIIEDCSTTRFILTCKHKTLCIHSIHNIASDTFISLSGHVTFNQSDTLKSVP